jgi:hypothetical protein
VERAMLTSHICLEKVLKIPHVLLDVVSTPEVSLLFLSYGIAQGLTSYLRRSSIQDAHDLAAAITLLMIFLISVNAQNQVLKSERWKSAQCKREIRDPVSRFHASKIVDRI